MDTMYPGRGIISDKNRKLFEAWSKLDPVDAWECERSERIARIQGRRNQIVEAACQASGLVLVGSVAPDDAGSKRD